MATSGSLGDVQREITHALDVACGVQSGHHDAQVGGHGCLLYEQGERLLFGGGAEVIDAGVVGDDLLGQPQVCTEQRTSGVVKGFGHQVAHVGETVGESVELLLVGVAHGERVAAFDCRQTRADRAAAPPHPAERVEYPRIPPRRWIPVKA